MSRRLFVRSTHHSKHSLRALAVSALLAMSLAACAPSGSSTGSAEGSERSDGAVVVSLPGSLSTLDVAKEAGILNYQVATITSEGLLGVNPTGEIVPAIAESWEQLDGSTYVFTIRQDAKFQDGSDLTVEDVLFSIDVARDPVRSPSTASYWPEEVEVEQTGDWEITLHLPNPSVAFAWTLTANGGLWITSKAFYEEAESYGSPSDLILGTGPYRATEFQPDSHATFTRVDTWWGGTPEVDEIDFRFIPDENTRLLAQQAGDTDIAISVPLNSSDQWEAIPNNQVLYESDRSYVGLTFDAGVPPFDDIHVRRAVAHALDRKSIVNTVLHGKGEVATGLTPPAQLGAEIGEDKARTLLDGLTTYDFDLDAAKQELAQSSVPNGFDAELTYPNSGPQLGQAALTLAENLKPLGINLTVTEKPVEEWISKVGTGEYGLYYMWYLSTTGDAGEIPGWLLGEANPARYTNDDVTRLMTESAGETDPQVRAEKITAASNIAQTDVAYSPAWWGESATAFGPRVKAKDYGSFFFMTTWPTALTVEK